MKKYLGLIFIIIGLGLLVSVLYVRKFSQQTRTFSPYTLLTSSWENYKTRFINNDGRVIDYSQGDITTSEGQSYALLQSVWMDDKATFDKVWSWTKDNMKRPGDNLLGWRWGKLDPNKNSYGFLPNGGNNSAADADTDTALALVLAGERWRNSSYTDQAKPMMADIWKTETDVVNGKRYLVAGNWAIGSDKDIVNPSYLAPYAWRIFAKIDTQNDWSSLINPAYELLTVSSNIPLDKNKAVGLPPDWVAVSKPNGSITASNTPGLTTNYSFDAMRVPWRVAVDYVWNKDTSAQTYLQSLKYLEGFYQQNKKLPTGFDHAGNSLNPNEDPVMYATALYFFRLVNQNEAQVIYNTKIINLYSNDTNSFRNDLPYYETNWLWFGTALYLNYLVTF
ncbi:glycosyl hydrolase family 8 [Patescibacteria group bacterium]|nr:glycosyl hydrolase family 8 [Patescibacteria group bacterium]